MFRRSKTDEVSPQDAVGLHERGAVLLDVREPDEWAAGHAPGLPVVRDDGAPGAIA